MIPRRLDRRRDSCRISFDGKSPESDFAPPLQRFQPPVSTRKRPWADTPGLGNGSPASLIIMDTETNRERGLLPGPSRRSPLSFSAIRYPFSARGGAMNFYLMPSIEMGPRAVRRILERIPERRRDEAIHPGRFTPREVVAHLADWEPIMRERIRTAVTTPGATLQVFDEGQMALDRRYAEQDPRERAEAWAEERRITAAYLRSLQPEDWGKAAQHPERGRQTAEDLANLLLGHDLYHIEQLSESL
jgi:hypothetical protein